ncbi:unnamed protein product, partial [Heterosigma akashiwo]
EVQKQQKTFERVGHELSLAFHPFDALPRDICIRHGQHVRSLCLTECGLRSYENLELFPNIETLILDNNGLAGLEGCPRLPSLKTLWFNNNALDDLVSFMDKVMECFPSLEYLSCMRNPACPGLMDIFTPDLEACRLYRLYVLYRAPHLKTLDSTAVTDQERRDAAMRGSMQYAKTGSQNQSGLTHLLSSASQDHLELLEKASYSQSQPKVQIVRVKYDGTNSEGNRFITDDDL